MATIQETLMKMTERIKIIEKTLRKPSPDSVGGYWATMAPYGVLPGTAFSASTGATHLFTLPRNITLRKIAFETFTATTNNSTNYWSFALTAISGINVMSGSDFRTDTASVWTHHNYTTFNVSELNTTTHVHFYISFTKVGTPGNLSVGNPMVFFT